MTIFVRPILAALLLVGLAPGSLSLAQDKEPALPGLLLRSPAPANAIMYMHMPSLKKLMAEANIPGQLSGNVEEVWLISDLNVASLQPSWEAGYAKMAGDIDADALAATLKGYVDTVGGVKAIWTPSESYLVPLPEMKGRLGFLRPADRSQLADWVGATEGGNKVPKFLARKAVQPEQNLSLLLAVDLENTFSPVSLESRMATFDALNDQDAMSVAKLLSKVEGMSIIVGRRSLSECILTLEFTESPALLEPFATKLLTEILNRNGTGAPEVANWKASVRGNTLAFQGAISADSLDGVMHIFSVRGHADDVASASAGGAAGSAAAGSNAEPGAQPQDSATLMAYTSKKYFDEVNNYIERVRKYKAQSTGYRAKWNDQQARRLEELGTLNVDPQLIDYGANVASMLRGNAASIRSGNVKAGQTVAAEGLGGYGGEVNVSGYRNSYYGGYYGGSTYGYSYRNAYTIARAEAATSAQQRMAGFGSYKEAQAKIDQLTADTRRAMTDKYQIQF